MLAVCCPFSCTNLGTLIAACLLCCARVEGCGLQLPKSRCSLHAECSVHACFSGSRSHSYTALFVVYTQTSSSTKLLYHTSDGHADFTVLLCVCSSERASDAKKLSSKRPLPRSQPSVDVVQHGGSSWSLPGWPRFSVPVAMKEAASNLMRADH